MRCQHGIAPPFVQDNRSQSTNDTFPTVMHIAGIGELTGNTLPKLRRLQAGLAAKAEAFKDIIKIGRTHLMDATPVTLGQEFGGYAATIRYAAERLESVLPRVRELALGGTAVGTGINTPAGFPQSVIADLSNRTAQPFTEARNHFEAQGTRDSLVELSGVLKTLAVGLIKINNDLRWMSSGPTTGLAEIHLPDLQPGSSIMPGKVNPVIPEVVTQVAAQVIGNDAAVAVGGMQGHFELNVFVPMMARNLLQSIALLASASTLLAEKCVDGIEANREACERYAELTLSAATALNPYIGYDRASEIVKEAARSGRSLRDVAREAGVEEDVLDEALDYRRMAKPHS